MKRLFKLKSEVIADRRVSVHRITCACGNTDTMTTSAGGNPFPPEAVARHFRHKGWEVGDREGEDRCPQCIEKEKFMRRQKRLRLVENKAAKAAPEDALKLAAEAVAAMKDQPMPEAANTAPERTMSREDRRIIFGEIDKVYIDAQRGYEAGWSDKRVADGLGVPVEWVATLREENFGPEADNAEVRRLLEETRAIQAETLKALEELRALETTVGKKIDDLTARLGTLSNQASRITAALK